MAYGYIATRYPRQVAGLALIDSATPYQFDLPDYPGFYSLWRRVSALFPSLARVGIGRLTLGTGFGGLPPSAREDARAFASSPRELRSNRNEFRMLPTVFDQAKALKSLDGKPLAVLTADLGQQRGWFAAQAKLARLSTDSVRRTAHGATHAALLEDQRFAAITSRAIADLVRAARSIHAPRARSAISSALRATLIAASLCSSRSTATVVAESYSKVASSNPARPTSRHVQSFRAPPP